VQTSRQQRSLVDLMHRSGLTGQGGVYGPSRVRFRVGLGMLVSLLAMALESQR